MVNCPPIHGWKSVRVGDTPIVLLFLLYMAVAAAAAASGCYEPFSFLF